MSTVENFKKKINIRYFFNKQKYIFTTEFTVPNNWNVLVDYLNIIFMSNFGTIFSINDIMIIWVTNKNLRLEISNTRSFNRFLCNTYTDDLCLLHKVKRISSLTQDRIPVSGRIFNQPLTIDSQTRTEYPEVQNIKFIPEDFVLPDLIAPEILTPGSSFISGSEVSTSGSGVDAPTSDQNISGVSIPRPETLTCGSSSNLTIAQLLSLTPNPNINQEINIPIFVSNITPQNIKMFSSNNQPIPVQENPWEQVSNFINLTEFPTISKDFQGEVIEHVTCNDCTEYVVGTKFIKTWKIKNTGKKTWSGRIFLSPWKSDYKITTISHDNEIILKEIVKPGDCITISIGIIVPRNPGLFYKKWKLKTEMDDVILHNICCKIKVVKKPHIIENDHDKIMIYLLEKLGYINCESIYMALSIRKLFREVSEIVFEFSKMGIYPKQNF